MTSSEKDNSLSWENTYKLVRDYVVHEDSLINFRLNWLLVIQGLLFTAYGLSIREPSLPNIDKFRQVISLLGIATCILILLSILSAVIAIKNLEAFWRDQKPKAQKDQTNEDYERFPFITGGADPESDEEGDKLLRPIHKIQYYLNTAFFAPLLIPIIFLIAWIFFGVVFN